MSTVLLSNLLAPLTDHLEQPDVSELSINKPGEIWLERNNKMERQIVGELTLQYLKDLAYLIATFTGQRISEERPLLATFLPQGYRVQIVYPPAVNDNTVGFSIRKPHLLDCSLDWQESQGLFTQVEKKMADLNDLRRQLLTAVTNKQYKDFLVLALRCRLNMLISGGTSTGKTTLLNSLLKEIPETDRIITIEDVPEIRLTQPNCLALFAARNQQGRALIDMQDLVEASLRLRPDRIIMGELRSSEAFSFLRAINTGHPGSIATLHADTPQLAFEQLTLMVMQKNLGLTREQIAGYTHSIIDIVVQLTRSVSGSRYISEIYYNPKSAS